MKDKSTLVAQCKHFTRRFESESRVAGFTERAAAGTGLSCSCICCVTGEDAGPAGRMDATALYETSRGWDVSGR